MTDEGERVATVEGAIEGLKKSVDLLRDDVHEALKEGQNTATRVALLEARSGRADWWMGLLIKAVLPVMVGLLGLGVGAYIQRAVAGS